MRNLFNTDQPSPYELLPTETLLARNNTTPSPCVPTIVTSPTKTIPISRELDKDSAERILDYIYNEVEGRLSNSGTLHNKKKKKNTNNNNNTNLHLDENGHRVPFHIPSMNRNNSSSSSPSHTQKKTTNKLGFLDTAADYIGIKSESNMKNINKEVLKNNDITIEVLITECRVSITDLYVAGILTHFDDLIELGFKATDLMLNTELFSCSSLVRLFKVNHDDMKLKKVEIDLEALIVGKFCSSDLEVLKFSLAPMIESGQIAKEQLWSLRYSFNDLLSLGLNKSHVDKLGITKKEAIQKVDRGGWAWPKEYEKLLPSPTSTY